jgi:hypothetical protein
MVHCPFLKPIKKAGEVTFVGLPMSRFRPTSNHQIEETVCALTNTLSATITVLLVIDNLMHKHAEGRSPHTVATKNVNFYR